MNRIERDQPIITLVNVPPTANNKVNGETLKDVYSDAKIPAVGPAIINSVLLEKGYQNVETIDPRFNRESKFTDAQLNRLFNSDIVGATSMTRNKSTTLNLFEKLKEYNPNITTIAGGFSPSFERKKWLAGEKSTDFVVIKEGPTTIVELLDILKNEETFKEIKGISYKEDGQIKQTPERKLLTERELAEIPTPFYSKSILDNLTTYAVIGSHGCPGNCDFCGVRAFHEGQYRREPDEKIIKQIKNAPVGSKIFFVDDNFAPLIRLKDARQTMQAIIDAKLNNRDYFVQLDTVTVNRDPNFIKLCLKMGIFGVFLGIESMNPDVLRKMRKPATVKQNEEAVKKFKDNGIYIHAMTIAGSEGDTYESIEVTNKWLIDLGVNSMQVFAQIPIAGSKLAERKSVLPRVEFDSSRMDGQNVVTLPPDGMTCTNLQNKVFEMYQQFYSKSRILDAFKPLRLLISHPERAIKLTILNLLIRIYAEKTINSVLNNQYTKEWQNYLREIDQKIYEEGKKSLAKKGVIFETMQSPAQEIEERNP